VVSQILRQTGPEGKSDVKPFKSIIVEKDIDVDIDLGNLLVADPNPLDFSRLRTGREAYLLDLARDNVQLLVNKLWELPSETVEDAVVVKLPAPRTRIPREKPVPAPQEKTRWEKFAAMKGIQKKKKGRMVFDEQSKEYKPRWGYNRANDDTKDWLIPVPDQADPSEDQFEKRMKAKKERIAKNELQRLRNLARNMKGKVPGVGLTPTSNPDKDYLNRALIAAKTSNASVGTFTETLAKEKQNKTGNVGKKRKFEPNYSAASQEKQRALDILTKLHVNEPLVDKHKAAKIQIADERLARSSGSAEDGEEKTHGRRRRGKSFDKGKRNSSSHGGNKSFDSKPGRFNPKSRDGKGTGGFNSKPGRFNSNSRGGRSPGGGDRQSGFKNRSPGGKQGEFKNRSQGGRKGQNFKNKGR